jgi:hypothetical protein
LAQQSAERTAHRKVGLKADQKVVQTVHSKAVMREQQLAATKAQKLAEHWAA